MDECMHKQTNGYLLFEMQVSQHLLDVFGGILVPSLGLHNHFVLPDVWCGEQPGPCWSCGLNGPQQIMWNLWNVHVVP